MDKDTKDVLNHGAVLMEVLKQGQYDPYPVERQIIEMFAAKNRYLENIDLEQIRPCLDGLYSYISSSYKEILDEIVTQKIISKQLEEKMHLAIKQYFETR